jgi:hypothetical protein
LNWGSRIMVPEYGFVLNDSMDDFSIKGRPNGTGYEPTKANYGESTGVLVSSEEWSADGTNSGRRETPFELELPLHSRERGRGDTRRRGRWGQYDHLCQRPSGPQRPSEWVESTAEYPTRDVDVLTPFLGLWAQCRGGAAVKTSS